MTVDAAAQLDIDDVVPLKDAWRSGASEWSTEGHRAFANGLAQSQRVTVFARFIGRHSSNRRRDLADLLLITQQETIEGQEAHQALHREADRRRVFLTSHTRATWAARTGTVPTSPPRTLRPIPGTVGFLVGDGD
ncbi:hypothetical protein [Streptomyces malaysiensis]|uniref:hypothetical protein n=1 Tax=Streptomyces malaysiensis TaxID=92644 RepID=UPI0037175DDC